MTRFNDLAVMRYATEPTPGLVPDISRNLLLGALPEVERRQMTVSLELVSVRAGQILTGAGLSGVYAYFPVDCVISLVYTTQDGGTAEVAVIGNEGVAGFGVFIGGSPDSSAAVVRCPGPAYRIKLGLLKDYFDRSAPVRELLLRYMQALLAQSSQVALCNRHHTVEQQLCRWLLAAADRLRLRELSITQEAIAGALGVRRAGITEAACRLQHDGLIQYRRGKVELLDRGGLERRACECYSALKKDLLRLLPAQQGTAAGKCVPLHAARPVPGHGHTVVPLHVAAVAPDSPATLGP